MVASWTGTPADRLRVTTDSAAFGRGAAVATVGTALSRATGFLRLAAMAYALGITENRVADTYQLANSTPNIIFELVLGGILSSVILRVYVEVREKEGPDEGWRFIQRVTSLSTILLVGLSIVGFVLAPFIFRLYTIGAPGADSEAQRMVGTLLLRLFIPQVIFYGFSQISDAVLKAHRRFGVSMFAPVLNNLVVTATFIVFASTVPKDLRTLALIPRSGVILLGLGTTLGVVALGLVPFFYMRRVGWKRQRGVGLRDPRMRRLAHLSAYMLAYVATNQAGLWIALVLANRVQGGVAGYQTAFVFFQLPHGLLAVSIATVIYTGLTERSVVGDQDGFALRLGQGLRGIVFVTLPAIAGYLAIAPQIVRLLIQHGLAGSASTELISTVLRIWAPGILFFSIFYMLLRAFYALGDTRTPMLINLAAFAVNITVDIVAFFATADPILRIGGLALGHACSYLVASTIALVVIRRRLARPFAGSLLSLIPKALLASAATGAAAWAFAVAISRWLGVETIATQLFQVVGGAATGLLVYAGASRILRVEEMKWIFRVAMRRSL